LNKIKRLVLSNQRYAHTYLTVFFNTSNRSVNIAKENCIRISHKFATQRLTDIDISATRHFL